MEGGKTSQNGRRKDVTEWKKRDVTERKEERDVTERKEERETSQKERRKERCHGKEGVKRHSNLDFVPRICPTITLERPIPIICTDVASPMAVPKVAWGTTSGMEGHMLAWLKHTLHSQKVGGQFGKQKESRQIFCFSPSVEAEQQPENFPSYRNKSCFL